MANRIKGIKNIFTTVVTAISTFLSTAWNTIKTVVKTAITTVLTAIQGGDYGMEGYQHLYHNHCHGNRDLPDYGLEYHKDGHYYSSKCDKNSVHNHLECHQKHHQRYLQYHQGRI